MKSKARVCNVKVQSIPIVCNSVQHQLMGSSYGIDKDVMGNWPSTIAYTRLCDSSQLCQCVSCCRPLLNADWNAEI